MTLLIWGGPEAGAAATIVSDQKGAWDLTQVGSPTQVAGPGSLNSYQFSALGDYLNRDTSPDANYFTAFSWSCFVWFDSFAGATGNTFLNHLGSAGANNMYWRMRSNASNSNKIEFSLFNQDATAERTVQALAAPSTSTWYHVLATNSASQLELFIDDASQGTDSTALSPVGTASAPFRIGDSGGGTADATRHRGRVQGVGFWDRVLPASSITDLYNSGNSRLLSDFP